MFIESPNLDTTDSSVGRAGDCRGNLYQQSLGRWFESGSVDFSLNVRKVLPRGLDLREPWNSSGKAPPPFFQGHTFWCLIMLVGQRHVAGAVTDAVAVTGVVARQKETMVWTQGARCPLLVDTQFPTSFCKIICQKWDSNPRPHKWTRMLHCWKEATLESGALDRSAILTCGFGKISKDLFAR